jgi:hypothetical protein
MGKKTKKPGEFQEQGSGLSRRDFLKGAASGAVGITIIGALGACENPTQYITRDDPLDADSYDKEWKFMLAPDLIPDSQIEETVTKEVVVVGSGMSGLCCATALAEGGVDVMVVSAGHQPISRGGSNQAIGSQFQTEQLNAYNAAHAGEPGFEPYPSPYTPSLALEHVKLEQLAGIYAMDKIKWSRWLQNSGISMDWMVDKMANPPTLTPLEVNLEPPYEDRDGTLKAPPSVHNFSNVETPMRWGVFYGAPQCANVYADWIVNGYGKRIDYDRKAIQLVRGTTDNKSGRVTAVICEKLTYTPAIPPTYDPELGPFGPPLDPGVPASWTPTGKYVKYVGTKAIVLATGDFSKDRDMMVKYSPWAYELFKNALEFDKSPVNYDKGLEMNGLCDGAGQKMGLWVGAAWQRVFPNPCAINGATSGPTHAVVDNFWGLNLNINGKRYHNENTNFAFGAISKLTQPEQTSYGVWAASYADTQDEWETLGCSFNNTIPGGSMPQTPQQLKDQWAMSASTYATGNTPEELVDDAINRMGWKINRAEAIASIKRYDGFAKATPKLDTEFQVNPDLLYPLIDGTPLYMSRSVGASFLCVMGGLRTNEYFQVCDESDNPIPGLYNTGTMIGDFFAGTYNFGLPGQNLGACCLTLPWVLGKDIANNSIPGGV